MQKLCNRLATIKEGSIIRIDQVAAINREAYKKYRITCEGLSESDFAIAGITELKKQGDEITFFHSGDINKVIEIVARYRINDMQIDEPTLEEIFMHYYQ